MTTLIGHLIAGVPFIIIGLWYMVQAFRFYFRARESRSKFKVRASYTMDMFGGRLKSVNLDGILKIIASSLGIFTEIAFNPYPEGSRNPHVLQHIIVYSSFMTSGVIDVLFRFRVPLPPDCDFLSMALGLVIQSVIFQGHLAGRLPLDAQVHTYVIFLPVCAAACAVLEMSLCRHHFWASVAKGYFLVLQGSWFCEIGVMLYTTWPGLGNWDQHDHHQKMTATFLFTAFALVCFVITIVIGTVIASRCRKTASQVTETEKVAKKPLLEDSQSFEVDEKFCS